MNLIEHFEHKTLEYFLDSPINYYYNGEILVNEDFMIDKEPIGTVNIIIAQHYVYYYLMENSLFGDEADYTKISDRVWNLILNSLLSKGIIEETPESKRRSFVVISNEQ